MHKIKRQDTFLLGQTRGGCIAAELHNILRQYTFQYTGGRVLLAARPPARFKTTHNSTCGSRLLQQLTDEHRARIHSSPWNVFIVRPCLSRTKAKCANLTKCVWNGSYNSLALWGLKLPFLWVRISLSVCHFTKNPALRVGGLTVTHTQCACYFKRTAGCGPDPGFRAWLWPISHCWETGIVRNTKDKQSMGFRPSGICHLMFLICHQRRRMIFKDASDRRL